MQPFKTVPFKFTDEAFNWLNKFIEPIIDDYQKNAVSNSGLVNLKDPQLKALLNSKVWIEVLKFSKENSLLEPYPQLFIYKTLKKPRDTCLGNPHIDTKGTGGIETTVHMRLNIRLIGEDSTEMVWWDYDRTHEHVVSNQFINTSGILTGRLQARGDTLEEQWGILGLPHYRANNLTMIQEYASFVRTDILHALNWTGNQPRVLLSIRFKNKWSDLI